MKTAKLLLILILFQFTASAQTLRFLGYFSPTNEIVTPTNWVSHSGAIRNFTNATQAIFGGTMTKGGVTVPNINNATWFSGGNASETWTFSLSGATDPVITFGNNLVNVTTGVLQYGGNTVGTAANNLGFFAATTSAQFFGVISDAVGSSGTAIRVTGTASNGFVPVSNGAGVITWNAQSGSGSGAPVGTMVNSGASTQYALPYYTDTTGTNLAPSLLLTDATLTNFYVGGFYIHTLFVTNGVEFASNLSVGGSLTVTNGPFQLGITGVTIAHDSDGAISFTGSSAGADENWTFNLDDTANTVVMSSSSGVTLFDWLTGGFAISVNTIELGNASANTLSASGGVLSIEGVALQTASSTADFTNKGYDAAGTGNTLKQTKQLILQRPDYGDGAGAVPQTNTFTASGLMHYTFSGNAETNANWAVYEFDCPSDLDTTVEMTARFAFLSGGTDTDDYVFHLTYDQVAPGTAYPTGTGVDLLPIVMTVTPTTPANGDFQASSATTLTGWAAALTPGRAMQVRVARLQNSQDDGARDVQLVITYGSVL